PDQYRQGEKYQNCRCEQSLPGSGFDQRLIDTGNHTSSPVRRHNIIGNNSFHSLDEALGRFKLIKTLLTADKVRLETRAIIVRKTTRKVKLTNLVFFDVIVIHRSLLA